MRSLKSHRCRNNWLIMSRSLARKIQTSSQRLRMLKLQFQKSKASQEQLRRPQVCRMLSPIWHRRCASWKAGTGTVPAQAIAVYNEASQRVKIAIAQWSEFKTTKLRQLNQKLSEASLPPIAISEIEQEVQFLMSR